MTRAFMFEHYNAYRQPVATDSLRIVLTPWFADTEQRNAVGSLIPPMATNTPGMCVYERRRLNRYSTVAGGWL